VRSAFIYGVYLYLGRVIGIEHKAICKAWQKEYLREKQWTLIVSKEASRRIGPRDIVAYSNRAPIELTVFECGRLGGAE
jgi:hypothetical protein